MVELKEKHCIQYGSEISLLENGKIKSLKSKLSPGWRIMENKKLFKEFPFDSYKKVMAFAQEIAAIAEKENHHPDMCLHYQSVEVELSTHFLGGLSENDFIMAAKIDELK